MRTLFNLFGALVMGSLALIASVAALPLIAIAWPFNRFLNWRREVQLKKYLAAIGDRNFLCYNNRTEAKEFIEKEIIPLLDKGIEVIYINGQSAKMTFVTDNESLARYKLRHCSEFPQLLKVRNGQVSDEGVNAAFVDTMHRNRPMDRLMHELHRFFEIGASPKSVTTKSLMVV